MSQSTKIYQVGDLVNEMQRLMEASYPEIWIEGEISSLSTPASGHLYFTLKDEKSQLRCAMFRGRASVNHYRPKAGDLVRLRAKISVYSARGELQCIVQYIEDAGEGLLQRRFEELKDKLNKEGLFDASHKLTLPEFPRHIGLITSSTGAAVKDILTTLQRRCPGIPVTLYPSLVQGEVAAKTLITAIKDAVQHARCDVLIVGRGGGSMEDLWGFNDEALARAIYQCPIPIVSAVGHEVDVTIADYVADLRAPTPTAAAELLSPDNLRLIQQLESLSLRLTNSVRRKLQNQAQRVDSCFQCLTHPRSVILNNQRQLAQTSARLKQAISAQLKHSRSDFQQCSARFKVQSPTRAIKLKGQQVQATSLRLERAQHQHLEQWQQKFTALGNQLNTVSPLATLDRGFSITRDHSNAILRSNSKTKVGDTVKVQLKAGELVCEVQEIVE